jgi:hypothetical protein
MNIQPHHKRLPQVIQGVTVQAPYPFEAGHELTADQSTFLNRVIATRIGQTIGQRVKKQVEDHNTKLAEGEPKLKLEDHIATLDLQSILDKDYAEFDFTSQRGPAAAVDPVTKIARTIAEGKLKELPAVVKLGVGKLMKAPATTGTDYTTKWAEMIDAYISRNSWVTDLAKQQVEAAAAQSTSEDFSDVLGSLESEPEPAEVEAEVESEPTTHKRARG